MAYTGTHGGGARSDADTLDELIVAAREWLADDPDEDTCEELDLILARAEEGDLAGVASLRDHFAGMLEFGTAGLRGRIGAGPNRMNRAVVIRAAAGLTAYLLESTDSPLVVVGYDARTKSDVFALDTCAVVTGMGGQALLLPRPLPTPVLAYAVRRLGADAGVMVTASHNPPEDNGYKVYLGDGSQIVSPVDAAIAGHIARVRSVADVPRADYGWRVLGEELLEEYVARAVSILDDSPRDLVIVHTALHGVGTETVQRAFHAAGFTDLHPVPSQAEPDPDFPTVAFPNPEEPGAMDAAIELAEQTAPDIIIANDPDADRCAVAVPGPGGWRMLRGDEVGALIGAHLLARGIDRRTAVFANSIVSSRLFGAMAEDSGVRHEETLTGFKWISRVDGLRYGYEEALGYCTDPEGVRDKDGITAALLIAEQAATLKALGRSLTDVLDDLARAYGVYLTDSFSVRVADLELIDVIMSRLRDDPATDIAGITVERFDDLARGDGGLPPTDGLRYSLVDRSRVIVRPSGTEPKVKIYCEVIEPVVGTLESARARARARMSVIRERMESLTTIDTEGDDES